ncbi:MAG: glycoside hydrolase family 31 protein [Proteobacteria bacterium]|nr:glycoside hydrolase family 31 protein [Pseudomonadota bacterium]
MEAFIANTHYGVRNYLKIKSYQALDTRVFKLSLGSDKPRIKEKLEKSKSAPLNLFILFLSPYIVRFHYAFSDSFDLNINPLLDFSSYALNDQGTDAAARKPDVFIQNQNTINLEDTPTELIFLTDILKIIINKDALKIDIYDADGDLVSSDLSQAGFYSDVFLDGGPQVRSYRTYPDSHNPPLIYGLGDKTGELNRWGRRFINKPVDALGYDSSNSDPLYKDIPFFIALDRVLNKAHGIFFDNFSEKFFDFGKERKPSPYYYFGAVAGDLNYYYIHGPELSKVSQRFIELTGRPNLEPEFIFGYMGSGMAYTEKNNSAEELLNFTKRHQAENIFPTAFHLSSGYTLNEKNERLQFTWNPQKFPQPELFIKELRELGVELCVNLKPVLLKSHPLYAEAERLDLFINAAGENAEIEVCENAENGVVHRSLLVDYWGGEGSYLDFTKPKTQAWWKTKIKEQLLGKGLRGIWNDNNEYEIFTAHSQIYKTILMPNLMSKLSYEASLENNPELRPWILSRSGYAGIQKYAETWTGDNCSSFTALKYDTQIISSMGISGMIHCGCDIGGFWGDKPSPELFLRWIQLGVFSPRFTIHSYKEQPTEVLDLLTDSSPDGISFFSIAKKFMQLRDNLKPYLYQANYLAHTQGIPIQRPLIYDFQDDFKVREISFQYMLGEALLVIPVTKTIYDDEEENAEPRVMLQSQRFYLPALENYCETRSSSTRAPLENSGSWIDFFNFKEYPAGQECNYELDINTIPVFVKANSVVALVEKTDSKPDNLVFNYPQGPLYEISLKFRIFLNSQELTLKKNITIDYHFYEDDGNTNAYKHGQYLLRYFKFYIELLGDVPQVKVRVLSHQGLLKSRYIINIDCIYNENLYNIGWIGLS